MSNLLEIHIDDQTFQVEPGTMIIEVADQAGITIPRFCYHKKLPIAANCRMCLVDVEKSGKPLPACATPVTHGMVVHTHSAKALEAQKSVMEFLLINHPLDCPICDQGGQCELQDVAMGYGKDVSRYQEGKRSVHDKNLGSLIATDMTRCIHCTRCVRFGQEIAGIPELGTIGRGEHTEISTYIEKSLDSELSGNIIDLCPVGALTSKPFRFTARPWELEQFATIAPHDCVGSNMSLHVRRGQVLRAAPRENERLNETWLSDRDRFSYTGLTHEQRLMQPMIKQDGVWRETDWPTALDAVVRELMQVIHEQKSMQVGAQISASATVEECYLLQKWLRGLGVANIDHRLQALAPGKTYRQQAPGMNAPIASLNQQDVIVLIGSYLQREQPIIAHRVRQATLNGGKVILINSVDPRHNFHVTARVAVKPSQLSSQLINIITAVAELSKQSLPQGFSTGKPTDADKTVAKDLLTAGSRTVLVGQIAQNHPEATLIEALSHVLAQLLTAQWGLLTQGANAAGAWLAGAVPQQTAGLKPAPQLGLTATEQWQAQLAAYILVHVEPELDTAVPTEALAALKAAKTVIAFTAYATPQMLDYAHILLPSALFAETAGTFVNVEGEWQSFRGVAAPPGQARPIWKILRVLGQLTKQEGFEYASAEDVLAEIQGLVKTVTPPESQPWVWPSTRTADKTNAIERISFWPIYRIDPLVRRSVALQQSATAESASIWLHPDMAAQLQLAEGQLASVTQDTQKVVLPVRLSERIPQGAVYIPAGFAETAPLGSIFSAVTVERS